MIGIIFVVQLNDQYYKIKGFTMLKNKRKHMKALQLYVNIHHPNNSVNICLHRPKKFTSTYPNLTSRYNKVSNNDVSLFLQVTVSFIIPTVTIAV